MSSNLPAQQEYKPGDVANGHVLTDNAGWVPVPSDLAPAKKKHTGLKVLGGLSVATIAIIVVASAAKGGGSKAADNPSRVDANGHSANEAPAVVPGSSSSSSSTIPKPKPVTGPKIGTPVTDNHMVFVVRSVKSADHVGSGFMATEAPRGGKFVIVDMTVRNTDKKEHDVNGTSQTLIDAKGARYDSSSDAMLALSDGVMLDSVNPGVTKHYKVAFEMPAKAKPAFIEVTGGWLSDGTKIALHR